MVLQGFPLGIRKIAWITRTHSSSLSYELSSAICKPRSKAPFCQVACCLIALSNEGQALAFARGVLNCLYRLFMRAFRPCFTGLGEKCL